MSKNLMLILAAATVSGAVHAAGDAVPYNSLRQAYYGDLHLHTANSFDAYIAFGTHTTPDEAYRFARGETIQFEGRPTRRGEALDFLAVTDHSENLGVFNTLDDPNSSLSKSEYGQLVHSKGPAAFFAVLKLLWSGKPLPADSKAISKSAWEKEIEAANNNYEPGKFTTFIAYEWTSMPQGKYNLHRNVFFRGDTAPYPFTSADSNKPEDLWTYLESNRRNGIEALAIAHNGNASGGLMYDWKDSNGRPIDEVYAERRALNEPLTEISQNKGSSETHPLLSPADEFSNFEIMDHLLTSATEKSSVDGSYVRDALGRGLEIQRRVGVNPYKFGFVGASDFHNGLSTSSEEDYVGLIGGYDPHDPLPDIQRIKQVLDPNGHPFGSLSDDGSGGLAVLDTGSGNLTGVWAESNTRESIYDALRRKETFATSGTRLKFRFFGGWNYSPALLKQANWVKTAYAEGVPMGGDLPVGGAAHPGQAPRFAIWAVKDPDGANLDRAQVVKVWLKDGKYQEKVFDVALSGHRKVDPRTGKAPLVGDTVDLKTATYKNSIGSTEFATLWRDPQFDPKLPAVYYLRVIEIPTPRWSTILAVKAGLPLPQTVPATLQERGWSSPIWYTPAKS